MPDTPIGVPSPSVERYRIRHASAPSGAPSSRSSRSSEPGAPAGSGDGSESKVPSVWLS
jgi:hypothetical protein